MNTNGRLLRILTGALTLALLLTVLGAVPARPAHAQTGGLSAAVLSDGQFVYGPNAYDFDLTAWLEANAPHLLPYAAALEGTAGYASVNPRLLLVLMELRAGLVSNPAADPANPFGWTQSGFDAQLEAAAEVLTSAYYLHLHHYSALDPADRSLPPIPLADGSELAVAPEVNAGTYAVLAFLAQTETAEALPAALEPFPAVWAALFPDDDPLDESNQVYIPGSLMAQAVPPPSLLQFPYPRGEAWYFGGVHHVLGYSGSDASSIDFWKVWLPWTPTPDTSQMWVVAAHSGWAQAQSSCRFIIYTNPDRTGWATRYYHLENIQSPYPPAWNSPLFLIAQNARIGNLARTQAQAICDGGAADFPHVHFSLIYNGSYVPFPYPRPEGEGFTAIAGAALSGWVVYPHYDASNNLVPYSNQTYLRRGTQTVYAYQSRILNDYSPLTPTPLSPANGAVIPRTSPVVLSWSAPPDAAEYFVELRRDGNLVADSGWITTTSYDFGLRPGGTYTWRVKARDATSYESPWSEAWMLTVSIPDLAVTGLSASPSLAAVGQPVTVSVTVTNLGTEAVASDFRVDLYLDNAPAACGDFGGYSAALSGLAAGASQTLTFNLPAFPATGDHTLRAYADSACVIEEAGEINNQAGPLALGVREILAPGYYDDTDPNIVYTGDWDTWTSEDLSGGSAHFSQAQGSAAEFIIAGSQFTLIYTKDNEYGEMDIYVDGAYLATINQDSDPNATYFQQTWTSPNLGPGPHLVRLVQKAPGLLEMVEVDAVHVPPAPVSNLQASYAYNPGRVLLTWTLSPDDNRIDGYRIFRNGVPVGEVLPGVNTFTDTDATCNTTDTYTVRAYITIDEDEFVYSSPVSVPFTTGVCPPAAFSKTAPADKATGVSLTPTLTWAASSGASGYEYCLGTSSGACNLVPWTSTGSNTQVTLASGLLEGGTTYYWQVRASNIAGTTLANGGTWWSFTTLAPDLVVTGITVTPALPLQGQQVTIEVAIRNQGTGPTPRSGFMVDLYVDRTPSACSVAGDYYTVTGELAAGASRVITFTTNALPAGTHTLRAFVDTDCVVRESNESNNLSAPQMVYIAPILGEGVYDDTAPIAYQGGWAIYTASGPYNNTLHYSTVLNSSAAFAVNAPRFRLLYTGYPNRGFIEIYIDGVLYAAINQYSASPAWQQMWDSGFLPGPTPHLVQIVHKSGAVVDVDAVIVINDTTPPAAITTLAAGSGSATGSVNLIWLSPGDDGNVGTAAAYLVRYAASPILTESDWNAATPVASGIPAPLPANSAQNMTITGLIPGSTYYFSIRAVDDVGNVGGLSVSPSAVAKPASPLEPGAYNDTSLDIYYLGAWQTYTGSGPTNNTLRYSTAIGDEAIFQINGNRFTLTYTGHTNRGLAEIYVDGVLYATVNQYASSLTWQRTWTSGILTGATPHTIRIVHKTGTYIDVDAVTVMNVPPPAPLNPGTYEDTNTNIVYSAGWLPYTGSGPTANTLQYSTTVGSEASFQINGNRFSLTYTANSNRGTAEIYVDGALYATLNQYNATLAWQRTWTSGILTGATPHTVRIVHKSGSVVDLDAVTVMNVPPPAPLNPGVYEDTNTNIIYTGPWQAYSGSGPTNNTLQYSTTIGSEAAFQINGNRFSLTYTGFTNRGTAEIYVDGALYATLNQYNATLAWQRIWTSGILPGATPHTVRIVHKTGSVVDLDAVTVMNVPPPAPLNPGTYEDTNTNIIYSAGWLPYTGSGPTNNTLQYSTTIGSEATFQINGNRFTLTYTGLTNRGVAEIYVDGVLYATLNQYNSSLAWQRIWTSGILPGATPHTIRIVHKSGAVVDLDAVTVMNVSPPAPLNPGTYENTNANLLYTGPWEIYTGSGPTANSLHYSTTVGSDVIFQINGNRFGLTYTGFTNRGVAEIYVDGALYATLNQYNATLAWQRTWTSGVLPGATPHTVQIVHKSGAVVDVDAVTVSNAPALPLGVYNNTHASIFYRGAWTLYSATGPTEGNLHYSTAAGNDISFGIEGHRFALIYTGFTNRGTVEIYVDGVLYDTLNQYDSALVWQKQWVSGILPGPAPHVIRLVHKTGSVVDLDGVIVLPGVDSTAPAAITDLAAYVGSYGGNVDLFWTAPGDDGSTGTATRYLVRYAAAPILTEADWNAATPVTTGVPAPYPAGLLQSMTVSGLTPERVYYFAVRAEDEEFNRAGLSNSASAAASLPVPLLPGNYDQNHANIAYRGAWTTYTNAALYGGSAARSAAVGNDILFLVDGSQFRLTYTVRPEYGDLEVYVEGTLIVAIGQMGSLAYQRTWTSPDLSAYGSPPYTVRLRHLSGTYVELDAVSVYP